MTKTMKQLQQDKGFILVTSMLALLILSFMGIAASRNTTTELQISGNDKLIKELFYDAESAAVEPAALMNNEDDPDELIAARTSKKWIIMGANNNPDVSNAKTNLPQGKAHGFYRNKKLIESWTDDDFSTLTDASIAIGDKSVKFSVVDNGIAYGRSQASSIKITASSVHQYQLYGYANKRNASKLITIGYRKRF